MLSTMPTMRGWQARTTWAPAAWRALLMNQANDSLSPTPVTRATLPVKSMGIIARLLDGGVGVGLRTAAAACNGGGQPAVATVQSGLNDSGRTPSPPSQNHMTCPKSTVELT